MSSGVITRIPGAALAVLAYLGMSAVYLGQDAYRARLEQAEYAPPPEGMVFVPPGWFVTGSGSALAGADEGGLRSVFLPGFYIDRHEVTNAAFARFDSSHTYPEDQADYPVTGVTLARARQYAAWAGKRLPSRFEWEKAARGTDGRAYPWGNEFRGGIANVGDAESLCPVGSHPESASPYGAEDMAGNAWEWVEGVHEDGLLFSGTAIRREVIKGGGYSYSANEARASYNGFEAVGGTCNDVGFRCALDAVRAPRS